MEADSSSRAGASSDPRLGAPSCDEDDAAVGDAVCVPGQVIAEAEPAAEAEERGAAVKPPDPNKLDPNKTAVLFIEYQNAFMKEEGELYSSVSGELLRARENKPGWGGSFVENSQRLLTECRELDGLRVVHAPITYCDAYHQAAKERGNQSFYNTSGVLADLANVNAKPGGFGLGKNGAEFYADMQPVPAEHIVMGKRGLDSFPGTDLDEYLREHGIRNL